MENDDSGKTRILKLFFEDPFKEYYLREIANIEKIPVDNAHKYLYEFVKKGFLKMRKTKKKKFFSANLKNDFLLKRFEYFEMEKTKDFFRQNPPLSKLKDITNDILTLIQEPVMVLYEKSKRNILLVTSHGNERLSKSKVLKTMSLAEFKNMMKKEVNFKDMIVLYNEFLFWKEIRKIGKNA